MARMESNPVLYFMYSAAHVRRKNEIESGLGRRFVCGDVIVSGKKRKYSYVATTTSAFEKEYPDAKIITSGYKNKMIFTDCSTVRKGS